MAQKTVIKALKENTVLLVDNHRWWVCVFSVWKMNKGNKKQLNWNF